MVDSARDRERTPLVRILALCTSARRSFMSKRLVRGKLSLPIVGRTIATAVGALFPGVASVSMAGAVQNETRRTATADAAASTTGEGTKEVFCCEMSRRFHLMEPYEYVPRNMSHNYKQATDLLAAQTVLAEPRWPNRSAPRSSETLARGISRSRSASVADERDGRGSRRAGEGRGRARGRQGARMTWTPRTSMTRATRASLA